MGITYIEGTLTGPTGRREKVEFLVDSGPSYSLLPSAVWQSLELEPKRTVAFTLADGTRVQPNVSECHVALAGQDGHSPVILGEPGDDQALLGAITLENLGLVLDPFRRTLQAMQMRLA
jgi:predicted aspartyl protease